MTGDPSLLEDWITIWHSELAAAITDREAQETLLRLVDLWAAAAREYARALSAPRAAPAAAAPDGRDAVIAGLLARVAELERRLDGA